MTRTTRRISYNPPREAKTVIKNALRLCTSPACIFTTKFGDQEGNRHAPIRKLRRGALRRWLDNGKSPVEPPTIIEKIKHRKTPWSVCLFLWFPAVTTVRKTITWILYVQLVGPDLPKGREFLISALNMRRRDICYLKSRCTAITIRHNTAVLVYQGDTPGLRGRGIARILSKSWCVTNDSRSECRCV